MIKVLLVYEDFNLLTLTESCLKKVGFDIQGVSNEILIQDQILAFNPNIIVASGKSQRVSIFSVGQKLKNDKHFRGQLLLIAPQGMKPTAEDLLQMKFDAVMEQPVLSEKLIACLCRLSGMHSQPMLSKFAKARMSDPELEQKIRNLMGGSSNLHVNSFSDPMRAQKYNQIAKDHPISVQATSHHRADIIKTQKDLKKDWDFDKLEELDELKHQFAEALFKKAK